MTATSADHNLLFGLLALQNGLINQGQLVAAFQAWSLNKDLPLADHLMARGDLDAAQRGAIDAIAALHIAKHGGDTAKSLAAIPTGPSTCESLGRIGDPDLGGSLVHVGSDSSGQSDDPHRTTNYWVGSASGDGQRFRVLRPHARGGLGAIFVALDSELHREVALKQILDHHADEPTSRRRFMLEAEVTGGLEHPGIVPVYGLGTYGNGRPYYAMRLIRGDSLKDAIGQFHGNAALKNDPGLRSLELRKLLRRFIDVCNAIEYAHGRGVLHRDVKPANIIVGKYGETLVLDWGLAKTTGRADPGSGEGTLVPTSASGSSETLPGSALGTPAYMSPEQARGDLEQLGPRSDVYSLGATLYCLLTGRPPVENTDVGAALRAVQGGEFPRPREVDATIDQALEAVCLRAMASKPVDRYASPRLLADDIERWMADEPVSTWREPWIRRARRWAKRHRMLVTGAAAALVVALGAVSFGAVLISWQRTEAVKQRDLARGNLEEARRIVDEMYTHVADSLGDQAGMDAYQREILEKALRFYEAVALPQSNAPELRYEAVLASFRVAEIRRHFNELQVAEDSYKRAVAISESLADDYPDRPEFAQEYAGSLNSAGLPLHDHRTTRTGRGVVQAGHRDPGEAGRGPSPRCRLPIRTGPGPEQPGNPLHAGGPTRRFRGGIEEGVGPRSRAARGESVRSRNPGVHGQGRDEPGKPSRPRATFCRVRRSQRRSRDDRAGARQGTAAVRRVPEPPGLGSEGPGELLREDGPAGPVQGRERRGPHDPATVGRGSSRSR
jgi:serine/threonine-protein kinase